MMSIVRRFVAFLVFFACAATANAQSYTYSIYIDADSNAATGCNVSTAGGPLTGIESVLAVTVTAGTPPTLNSVTRSSCNGASLGAPVTEGAGAISVGAGVGGTTSIEISDALGNISPPSATNLRLYAVAQSASGNDVLFTTTGTAGGQPIVMQLGPNGIVPTPLFGIPALLLLVAALLAFGSRAVRQRMIKRLMLGLVLLSGIAGAAGIFNWNGIGPLATDPAGDSSSGESAIDLRFLFAASSGGNAFFRLDVNSNLGPPPPKAVAVTDTYQATIDTPLNIAAPGVLANDTLNGATITGNTNPSHGTLALNVNGGFVYTPTTGFTGHDAFTYTLTNAAGNVIGNVDIVVQNGPAALPDNYSTIVGTALNVSAPGVLGNDNLGTPVATLQSFGGGSMGGAVTANLPGAAVALGASGGTLTLNANGSFNLTAPTTAGTYTFLYRIGNVKGTSDGTVTIQVNQAPSITSVGPANFVVGSNSAYTITTTGTPTVTSITLTGCTLPAGLSFTYTSGATATISGSATVGGTVSCTVTASNGISPNATQTLVVNANAGPSAQPDSYTTTVGTALNVSAPGVLGNDSLGSPAATLTSFGGGSMAGTVTANPPGTAVALGASGGTLTLNANGSISLTAPTTAGTYTFLYRLTNVQGTSDGTVTIQVNQAPTITSVGPANFSVGTNATYNITTSGTPTATSITLTGCVLPAGLSFNYTSGATATISGTATATGTVACTVTASNGVAPAATQSLTVNANAGPAAVADSYTTTVGTAISIAAPGVLTNDTLGFPAATLTKFGGGSLGGAVTDNNAGASVALTGSGGTLTVNANGSIALTAPTTPGTYTFLYRITNSQGSSDGTVTIQVNQAPTILSPNNVTFIVGTLQTFTITTSGTPTVTSITLTGCVLPAGLNFNYTSGATATISGTPTASGNVNCTVTASNGVAPAATQTLAVAVNQGPAAVADTYSTVVGTALNVSAPGVLQNDTLGNPLATLTFFGGNSLGGVVTDHAAGSSVAFGTSGGTLTVNADGSLGLTAPTTAGQYTFLYRIANGVSTSDAMVTININQSAAITSANSTTFIDGQANSFGVTTSGFPKPTLSIGTITPALAGVNFVDNGDGTGTLSGSPALGTAGTYAFTITAHNGIGADATQNFTLQVNEKPTISSGATTTFTVGSLGTFNVTTTGTPVPSIARGGVALPSGVNFVDNGNGTGTLSGTPAAGTGGSYAITFTATNSAGSSPTQNFTLVINEAPAITSAASTTFTVGSAGTFTVTTTGNPKPAISTASSLPGGVNLVDNGNGTATLAGTPSAGTGGDYPITIQASNGVGSNATQSFTLHVHEAPAITSANTITFTAGVSGTNFTVTTTGTPTPSIARSGVALPSGVTFTDNGNGTATLVNNPAAGTGGSYAITFTASNGVGSNAVQSFTLIVNQSPAITSANNASFVIGQAGQTFTVNTTGFPTGASMVITQSPNPDNLPANVTFTNNNNGTATIAGTPAAGTKGAYGLTISANNGVSPQANQSFTFNVTCPTINLLPGSVTFNANYNAAFSQTFTPSGGTAPYTYTLGGVALPGVGFSGNNLSGTPNNTGSFAFTVKATDANGCDSAVQSYTLNVNPVATNDTYNALGNVIVNSGSASFAVTDNDSFPAGTTISAFDAASAGGGAVTMVTSGANVGQFTYDPPVGKSSGTDTFTYTLSSNGRTAVGTVTFTIAGRVWFIDDTAGACSATCDGRKSHPFTNTSTFQTANTGVGNQPATNDAIFIYTGGSAYSGTITLLNGQRLIGQGATGTLASLASVTPQSGQSLPATAGTPPNLTSAGTTITTGTGNSIHGLTLGNATTALSGSGFGTLTVNDNVVINTNGEAIDLTNGTFNATFNSVTSTGGSNNINLVQVAGTVDLSGTSNGALSGATGTSLAIGTGAVNSGGSATITFKGPITQSTSGQAPVVVQDYSGTLTLSGAITATAAGVKGISLLSNNPAATFTFNGGLNLSTGANAAFTATGGGTVNVCDENPCNPAATGALVNTLTTTTGTALNVVNTTIGVNNLEFKSISANGGSNGIFLSGTGASGGLHVTGNAASVTNDGSGGTLQNMAGADASPNETAVIGNGVYLNATQNVSLNHMHLLNHANYALVGTNVTGFAMTYTTVDGTNGTSQGGTGEGDVYFTGLSGAATVDHSNFSGGIYDTFHVFNNGSQTLNRITITNSSFATITGATNLSNDALVFQGTGGTLNVTVQNSTFTSARGDLFQIDLHGTISSDLIFTGNTLTNNNGNIVSGGGGITLGGGGPNQVDTFTYNISNNTMRDALGSALAIGAGSGAGTNHNYSGTINNNTIGVAAVANSGSAQGSGIGIVYSDAGTETVSITNNHIYQYNNEGILLNFGAFGTSNPYLNATVTGNTISNPGTFGSQGILLTAGTQSSPIDTGKVCLTMTGNSMTGSGGNGATDFRVRDRFNVKVGLPSYAGTTIDNVAVQTFTSGNNSGASSSATAPSLGTTNGTTNGYYGTCPPP